MKEGLKDMFLPITCNKNLNNLIYLFLSLVLFAIYPVKLYNV